MDLVHKRAKVDRISNLPTEVIHNILSFLDLRYAIQTSKLSRKWRHVWTTMPHLNVSRSGFRTSPQFAKFVKQALSRRNNQTKVSTASFKFEGKTTQFVVRSFINYVYSHNVKQLNVIWFSWKTFEFPQCIFSSPTLKHLSIATEEFYTRKGICGRFPESAWDFPALETLNLWNVQVGDSNLFSKCVNLKNLTLHRCCMCDLDIFNVCAPQLSDLTITDPIAFPKVFNVIAPCLKNLTASICIWDTEPLDRIGIYTYAKTEDFDFLQFSEGLDSLEKVDLSFSVPAHAKKKIDVPRLLNLFQKLHCAKFLIVDVKTIETLSSCLDQLAHEPCPFDNLKSLKINALPLKQEKLFSYEKKTVTLKQKELIETMAFQVRNYLLESSPSATFVMDLPQVPKKRSRQPDAKAKQEQYVAKLVEWGQKVVQLVEQKQKAEKMVEEKRMLEAKLEMLDEVIAQQKVMQESMKLQHENVMSQIIKCKMTELQVQIEGGNPNYEFIRLMGHDIKSIINSTPESLRVAMDAQFYRQYEEVKSLLLTHIDGNQWVKVERELGCVRHSERTHSGNSHRQSDVAVPPAP